MEISHQRQTEINDERNNLYSHYRSVINYSTLFSTLKFTKHRKVQLATMDSCDSNEKIPLMMLSSIAVKELYDKQKHSAVSNNQ